MRSDASFAAEPSLYSGFIRHLMRKRKGRQKGKAINPPKASRTNASNAESSRSQNPPPNASRFSEVSYGSHAQLPRTAYRAFGKGIRSIRYAAVLCCRWSCCARLWIILSNTFDQRRLYVRHSHNPYNASFSVTNEGFTPAYKLRATCVSTFEWVPPPDAKVVLGELDYNHCLTGCFSAVLPYKQRASIPCNSNIAANGHPLMPGALD